MASNHNWVCFDCRWVIRKPKSHETIPKCQECGGECICLGYKIPIPKKRDVSAWKALETCIHQWDETNKARADIYRIRRLHELEKEIEIQKNKPSTKEGNKHLKSLETQLSKILEQIEALKSNQSVID